MLLGGVAETPEGKLVRDTATNSIVRGVESVGDLVARAPWLFPYIVSDLSIFVIELGTLDFAIPAAIRSVKPASDLVQDGAGISKVFCKFLSRYRGQAVSGYFIRYFVFS